MLTDEQIFYVQEDVWQPHSASGQHNTDFSENAHTSAGKYQDDLREPSAGHDQTSSGGGASLCSVKLGIGAARARAAVDAASRTCVATVGRLASRSGRRNFGGIAHSLLLRMRGGDSGSVGVGPVDVDGHIHNLGLSGSWRRRVHGSGGSGRRRGRRSGHMPPSSLCRKTESKNAKCKTRHVSVWLYFLCAWWPVRRRIMSERATTPRMAPSA